MAIANYNEEKPLIVYTFKKLCNGEQWFAAQHYNYLPKLRKNKSLSIFDDSSCERRSSNVRPAIKNERSDDVLVAGMERMERAINERMKCFSYKV